MTGRPSIEYARPWVDVVVVHRANRYLAVVRRADGEDEFDAHVPNPGRMEELLVDGTTAGIAVPVDRPGRSTRFDLVMVRHGRTWVSIDSRVGNRLVGGALGTNWLPGTKGPGWRAEIPWGEGRLDFGLRASGRRAELRHLIEVKCSNLAVGRTAMFPDAPTERGTRHVRSLIDARRRRIRATVVVLVQRHDVDRFHPNDALDPAFADSLRRAAAAGVRVRAVRTRVTPGRIEWDREIPVDLAVPSATAGDRAPPGAPRIDS